MGLINDKTIWEKSSLATRGMPRQVVLQTLGKRVKRGESNGLKGQVY